MAMQHEEDFRRRRLERLEQRYHRALVALDGARGLHAAVRSSPEASELLRQQTLARVIQAQQQVIDAQSAIELIEDQTFGAQAPEYDTPGHRRPEPPSL